MAEAIVYGILKQLGSIAAQEAFEKVKLIVSVDKEVKKLASNLEAIQAVLIDAEKRQVKEEEVKQWLGKLKYACYDIEDVLDEWNTKMMKLEIQGGHDDQNALAFLAHLLASVCSFFTSSCFDIKEVYIHHFACKIKELNENLDEIAKQKEKYHFNSSPPIEKPERSPSTSFDDDTSDICGRDKEKNDLVSKLLSESSAEPKGVKIISLIGMGGIGKSTLAQYAYHHNDVKRNFKRIWVSVSEPFDQYNIAKAIIEALDGSTPNLGALESLLQHLHKSIENRKFLLILDDVWLEDQSKWKPFYNCLKNGHHGSKVVITTRNVNVARMMKANDIISIKQLSEEDCWLIFEQLAFSGRSDEDRKELEEIGREIVLKCKGLPLAIKTIGSHLRFKRTKREWERILGNELWKMEEIEKSLLSSLMLSYYDLPPIIRQCFLYCTIFPKDYNIKKNELIRLWMAQGYLGLENNIEMEIIGQEYFDHLVRQSFFQDFEKDDDGNIIVCKMHDMVHDTAQFLNNNECMGIHIHEKPLVKSSCEKVRHLSLTLKSMTSFPVSSDFSVKKLRSFLIDSRFLEYSSQNEFQISTHNEFLSRIFGESTCLRVLILYAPIKEIPKEIGKLIHLRYLDLKGCKELQQLPESLCKLYNLQILNLYNCRKLELPQWMGKLINLRHLIIDFTKFSYMPIGIERLTCLRTLSRFIVSGDGDESKVRSLECLKNFKHLQGRLHIEGLGYLTNVSETKRIEVLTDKKNLVGLGLKFNKDGEGEKINTKDEAVLEALQPPPNLENLWISAYRGNTVSPHWMMSLTKLRVLYLSELDNCKHLPHLGKLPSLERCQIHNMKSLKRAGNEFWGIESDATSSSVVLFPKLKALIFSKLIEWEEWDYGITVKEEEEENLKIMPCLASLTIYSCPKLKALPVRLLQSTTLKDLEIVDCPILEERYKKGEGEDRPKIAHIPNIALNWKYVQGGPH